MAEPGESPRTAFRRHQPDFPLLGLEPLEATESFLRERSWIEESERFLGALSAGEGNMNLTLRVLTDRRSLILKQSRPWVEKYELIEAPFDRALVERRFYERVEGIHGVAEMMPRLLAADAAARALLLEDLTERDAGEVVDFTSIYGSDALLSDEVRSLGGYLRVLHRETRGSFDESLANREMRALNHEHIFRVPLAEDNGVPFEELEPGLSDVAARLRDDSELVAAVNTLGERYLADGPCLLHGDFFPGSWLRTDAGPRVIDPEFCFFGDPEFDIGVAMAHLALSGQNPALSSVLVDAAGGAGTDEELVARYAGVEVIRRLIGVAQLPIPPAPELRAGLLDRARRAVLEETLEAFAS